MPPMPSEPKLGTNSSAHHQHARRARSARAPRSSRAAAGTRTARAAGRSRRRRRAARRPGCSPRRSGRRCPIKQQEIGDARVRDDREQLRAPVGIDTLVDEPIGFERAIAGRSASRSGRRAAAAGRRDRSRSRRSRRRRARRRALRALGRAHGALGPVRVATAQLGEAADVGDGVVDRLALLAVSGSGALGARGLRRRRRFVASARLVGRLGVSACGARLGRRRAPPIDTGVAAPTLVPGAIAATWLASRM